MRKGCKKIVILVIAIVMLLTLGNVVMADDTSSTNNAKKVRNCGENYEWMGYDNDDGTFTLVGCNGVSMYLDGTLELPSYIEGKKVTRIEGLEGGNTSSSYDDYFNIFSQEIVERLVIPDTIEEVHGWSFRNFTNLKSITLPNNEKFYNNYDNGDTVYGSWYSFFSYLNDNAPIEEVICRKILNGMDDYSIKTIKFQEGESEIAIYNGFNQLSNVIFPNSAKSIIFYGNDYIPALNIPSSVTEIYIHDCPRMTSINIPSMVTHLEMNGCSNISELTLPKSMEVLALGNCPNLSKVSSPKSLSDINILSAYNCPNLQIDIAIKWKNNIYLSTPSGIDAEYYDCPYYNSGITSITIDEQCFTWYDKEWFTGMNKLENINVVSCVWNKYYSVDGVLYWSEDTKHNSEDVLLAYPAAKSTSTNYTLPTWVKCIYVYAFDACKFISITIPENVPGDFYWEKTYDNITAFSKSTTKLRVVNHSAAMAECLTTRELANKLHIDSDRIELYKGSQYNITYDLAGGINNSENPNSYTAGDDPITLKNPTREGYIFSGWKRNDIINGYKNTTERYEYFQDFRFIAVWTKIGANNPTSHNQIDETKNTIKKVKVNSVKVKNIKSKKVKITWKKVKSISGYTIQYATNRKFTKGLKKTTAKFSATSKTIKNLKKKKTYYFRIRVYKNVNGKKIYGAWSAIKKLKIKK